MSTVRYLVTGGAGFIGSALVRRLVREGHAVRVLDNQFRGSMDRLNDIKKEIEFIEGDIRESEAVANAVKGIDVVCHLASVNGTEHFYKQPELVLEVCVKGMTHVLDACKKHHVRQLVLASSSEVYQTPPTYPTDETVMLSIPDPFNPRYSYAAGKIISEMMAIHSCSVAFERIFIFRPHNVYGPSMGWEHVIPQFVLRMKDSVQKHPKGALPFPIQGTGKEMRSFVYIDDFIDGLELLLREGIHREIYHIGTQEEQSILDVARWIGEYFQREIDVVPGAPAKGGTARRVPDISKMKALGYSPKVSFREGLKITSEWYDQNSELARR